jgi:hypothetical protein
MVTAAGALRQAFVGKETDPQQVILADQYEE